MLHIQHVWKRWREICICISMAKYKHGVSGAGLDELGRGQLPVVPASPPRLQGMCRCSRVALHLPKSGEIGEVELTDSSLSRKTRQKTIEVDQDRKYLYKRKYFLLLKMRLRCSGRIYSYSFM